LGKKGVTELYFWGKDYLEDQLSLPQNDEILFTFFGLSLSPRRRSRTAELKFNINNKNKILKLIFGRDELINQGVPRRKTFLLRDIKADHYPDRGEYPDFEKHRRWEEHVAVQVNAVGVFFKVRERYAYLDEAKKEWDFSTAIDLIPRKHNIDEANQARLEDEGKKAERFWRHLPRRFQAKLVLYGFVPFKDMLIIDDRGDPEYTDPHMFIDFGPHGPFQHDLANLVHNRGTMHESKFRDFKRARIFPSTFPDPSKGKIHDPDKLALNAGLTSSLEYLRGSATLYSFDGKLKALVEGSLIRIPQKHQDGLEKHAEVTHVYDTIVGALLKEQGSEYYRSQLQSNAGRDVADSDKVTVYELHEVMLQGNHLLYLGNDRDW
jgi:hypothetical protein